MKKEESRGFNVFFVCSFGVWKREERVGKLGKEIQKMCSSSIWRVLGAIYSLGTCFESEALGRPLALKGLRWGWSWHPWKGPDFLFLKRCGSWKSNSRIKSYGSQKLAVHQLVCHLGFCDILAILTSISTHEHLLELESDNLRNGVGLNPFW